MATKTVQDSSLTAIADAIRAKTGKSASMEFPTEFVSEIASISGGGDDLKIITALNPTLSNWYFPDSIKTLTVERLNKSTGSSSGRFPTSLFYPFSRNSSLETITIDYGVWKVTNAADTFRYDNNSGTSALKTIHLYADTSAVTGWDRFMYATENLMHDVVVDGTPIDFSSMTKWQNTLDFRGLKEIRFAPDKINVSAVSIGANYTAEYSDDTWASLANALKAGTAGTFTIGSTAQATIGSIMGENDSGLFVLSQSGTMSLSTFITSVKGWTIA